MEQERIRKKSKLTYKMLFGYSLVVITLLVISLPVFAHSQIKSSWSEQSPRSAQPLSEGVNINHLGPGDENWYVYQTTRSNAEFVWVSLAMRYQIEAIIDPAQVNFEIIPKRQIDSPFQTKQTIGQGTSSSVKPATQNLIELFWTGQMTDELYYVRIFNHSPFSFDYTVEAQIEQPAYSGAIPASFTDSDEHDEVAEARSVNARQLRWILVGQAVADMSAEEAGWWMQAAQSVGWISPQGVPIKPNPTEANPELLWNLAGQAVAGLEPDQATEWLMQADTLGWLASPPGTLKDFSEKIPPTNLVNDVSDESADTPEISTPPEPEPYVPISIYPNNPLEFNFQQVNSGRLAPYGVHWYSLILSDIHDDKLIEDLALTMFTTPSNGFIDSRVNFEIFPASQYHIWARGDTNYMEHFGLGMWLSRDEDSNTGERLWSGSLVDGNRYFIKVINESPVVVDYYLFPGDIENAELGNPTLH
jgi:hypothetical protein